MVVTLMDTTKWAGRSHKEVLHNTRRMMHGFSVAIHDMSILVELRRSINACVSPFNCTRFLFVCSSTYTVSVVLVLKMSLWQRFRSIWPRRFFCAERWESNSKMELCKHYLFKFTCEYRSCCAHLGIVRRHVTEVPSDPNAPADCGVRRKSNKMGDQACLPLCSRSAWKNGEIACLARLEPSQGQRCRYGFFVLDVFNVGCIVDSR